MQTSLFHTNKSYLTKCIDIDRSCLQKSLDKSCLPKSIDKSSLPKFIDKKCLLVYNRSRGEPEAAFVINNAQICPHFHCTHFSILQGENVCLGVVLGYFFKYFLTVYSEFDKSLVTYSSMKWCFLCEKVGFFSFIDERESFKNLKYLENVSSICENNVNLVLLRVLHYTIVKTIVYGICKRDYINHMPVISKLSICWVHSIV